MRLAHRLCAAGAAAALALCAGAAPDLALAGTGADGAITIGGTAISTSSGSQITITCGSTLHIVGTSFRMGTAFLRVIPLDDGSAVSYLVGTPDFAKDATQGALRRRSRRDQLHHGGRRERGRLRRRQRVLLHLQHAIRPHPGGADGCRHGHAHAPGADGHRHRDSDAMLYLQPTIIG